MIFENDKYQHCFEGDEPLPHPEDIAQEDIYKLVGLYERIYRKWISVSSAVTAAISGDPSQDKLLTRVVQSQEVPLERWLDKAVEFLPEWYQSPQES